MCTAVVQIYVCSEDSIMCMLNGGKKGEFSGKGEQLHTYRDP